MDILSSEVAVEKIRVVCQETHADIGFIIRDTPSVNASSVEVWRGLLEGIHAFAADGSLAGIVIIGD